MHLHHWTDISASICNKFNGRKRNYCRKKHPILHSTSRLSWWNVKDPFLWQRRQKSSICFVFQQGKSGSPNEIAQTLGMGVWRFLLVPQNPDPPSQWRFWGPIHPCYAGPNASILEGPRILRSVNLLKVCVFGWGKKRSTICLENHVSCNLSQFSPQFQGLVDGYLRVKTDGTAVQS